MSNLSATHADEGTIIHFTVPASGLAHLAELVTFADRCGMDLHLAVEVQPDQHTTGDLKVKTGNGVWSVGLTSVSEVAVEALYDKGLRA